MTTTTKATPRRPGYHTLKLIVARSIHESLDARLAAWEADRDHWYRAGDGRSPRWRDYWDEDLNDVVRENVGGKGYRYPDACVHGASAWVDYDNICGPCESGYSHMEIALGEAGSACAEFYRRSEIAQSLRDEPSLPLEVREWLTNWTFEPLDDHLKRPHRARPHGPLP